MNKQKKDCLILITHNFPFGRGEAFLETEIKYLSSEFKQIIIVACNVKDEQTRAISKDISLYRYNTQTKFKGFLNLPFLLLSNLKTAQEVVIQERKSLKNKTKHWWLLTRSIIKALQFKQFLLPIVKKAETNYDKLILYSYWFSFTANAISLLKNNKHKRIARAHGGDLYDYANKNNYQPMLNLKNHLLNSIFFISQDGLNYYQRRIGSEKSGNLFISRLGVLPHKTNFSDCPIKDKSFTIVSCSNLIPIKRVHLIIESLSKLKSNIKIYWHHFGSGSQETELKEQAKNKLKNNTKLSYCFHGYKDNQNILDFYSKNPIDLFINVSKTEGIPVSIMEAMSFGIPVIATDVGGTNEIVNHSNGILLKSDPKTDEIKTAIQFFIQNKDISTFRQNAYNTWNNLYNADNNYPKFITAIKS